MVLNQIVTDVPMIDDSGYMVFDDPDRVADDYCLTTFMPDATYGYSPLGTYDPSGTSASIWRSMALRCPDAVTRYLVPTVLNRGLNDVAVLARGVTVSVAGCTGTPRSVNGEIDLFLHSTGNVVFYRYHPNLGYWGGGVVNLSYGWQGAFWSFQWFGAVNFYARWRGPSSMADPEGGYSLWTSAGAWSPGTVQVKWIGTTWW